jgi:hypothetical protein
MRDTVLRESVLKAIAVTAELSGTELSKAALLVMEADLADYPEAAVLHALVRCRRELTGRLTLAAIIERLEADDGRPGADEAWAIARHARDEAATVVWSAEMRDAFALARPLLEDGGYTGDKVGARMAFIDAYRRLVRAAREVGTPPCWEVSLGWDMEQRQVVLQQAATAGRLSPVQLAGLLPAAAQAPSLYAPGQCYAGDEATSGASTPAQQARENLARIARLIAKVGHGQAETLAERAERVAAQRAAFEQRRADCLARLEGLAAPWVA